MPDVKIVALGVAEVEQVVMACAKAGVSGFVAPSGSVKDVVAAVHSAVRGELVCSPRMAAMLLNGVSALVARPLADVDNDTLTQREREIVLLMSDGLSNKQIARSLGIQNATVKNHVHSILSKFRVRRRGEVAAQLRRGNVSGPENFVLPKLPNGRTNGYNGHGVGLDQTG
jgi:DNA-binding NarL/FixJ family response regulator